MVKKSLTSRMKDSWGSAARTVKKAAKKAKKAVTSKKKTKRKKGTR